MDFLSPSHAHNTYVELNVWNLAHGSAVHFRQLNENISRKLLEVLEVKRKYSTAYFSKRTINTSRYVESARRIVSHNTSF
jgi:tRNA A37 N6-isopentenylltransferase MiaA